jgi:predicted O-methyltransferase YrrM
LGQPLFTASQFIAYQFRAQSGWWLHSPFVFGLHQNVLKPASRAHLPDVLDYQKALRKNHQPVDVLDFKNGKTQRRTISYIAKTSSSQMRFSNMLRLLAEHLSIRSILETGTSLGVNCLNLCRARNVNKVISIEGSAVMHQCASRRLQGESKVQLIHGRIEDVLISSLERGQPEMVFLDADHRGASVLRCLDAVFLHAPNVKAIVVHDIYWSSDMQQAWKHMVSSSALPLTVDIFQAGMIFPRFDGAKQHFVLKF